MNDNKILIVDIETTGFQSDDEIVEIGIVSLDINTGEKEIIYDQVFCPLFMSSVEIDDCWIVQRGYITTDEILEGANILNHLVEIQDIISAYPLGITAYNNAFDFKFLQKTGFYIKNKLPCPMKLSRPIVKALDKRNKIKNPSVMEAYYFLFPDSEYVEQHRGADDAFHEADVVFELIKMDVFKINK